MVFMNRLIIFGSDHAGRSFFEPLSAYALSLGWDMRDITPLDEKIDYPDVAHQLATEIIPQTYGILVCGSGIGMSIAANRHPNIRAALCQSALETQLARAHNNANVLCLGARIIDISTAIACLHAFLTTDFEAGRHEVRIQKINNL